MKINLSSRITRIFKRILNVRYWVDYDRLKLFTTYLANGFERLFIPKSNTGKGETFEAAVTKMNLNETSLNNKKSALYRLSMIMTAVAFLILVYAFYQLIYGSYKAVLVSLVIMAIALALAFRYHFWYYQIKERKLGCSIAEWYRQGLRGKKR